MKINQCKYFVAKIPSNTFFFPTRKIDFLFRTINYDIHNTVRCKTFTSKFLKDEKKKKTTKNLIQIDSWNKEMKKKKMKFQELLKLVEFKKIKKQKYS